MKAPLYTDRSETYEAFLAIEPAAYKEKIQYIEENFFMLRELDADEYFDMMVLYAEALFETSEYSRQAKLADHILEMSIERNIVMHRGQDIYFETLFKKAASLHNLDKVDQAVHILKELLKIDPDHESSKLFLINCLIRQKKYTVRPYRNISLVLLLLSACVIAFELLFVRRLWPTWFSIIEMIRNGLFITGVILLTAGEVIVRYRAVEDVYSFTRKSKRKKEGHEVFPP
ncbi:MAG: tetratricopeptide repeat protein [Saprospiraceae bacterium]